jgi:hypothetical protein
MRTKSSEDNTPVIKIHRVLHKLIGFRATKKFPAIYRTRKFQLRAPILNKINQVYTIPPCLFQIRSSAIYVKPFQAVAVLQDLQLKPYTQFSFLPCVPHAQPT